MAVFTINGCVVPHMAVLYHICLCYTIYLCLPYIAVFTIYGFDVPYISVSTILGSINHI